MQTGIKQLYLSLNSLYLDGLWKEGRESKDTKGISACCLFYDIHTIEFSHTINFTHSEMCLVLQVPRELCHSVQQEQERVNRISSLLKLSNLCVQDQTLKNIQIGIIMLQKV